MPLTLYINPVPAGVIVMVPVGMLQSGCWVTEAPGAAGVDGCGLMAFTVAKEIQPEVFFTVMLYVPGVRLGNVVAVP